ncbi:hypothetical protein [Parazoarcus communis]|uniref:hypothetical protein n=1 Tax=Parazoarcus communis TaxID=41977 RepID=UPI001F286B53|nr:hypothetical protein [Parazoarcus communis]
MNAPDPAPEDRSSAPPAKAGLPPAIWMLGFVSLLMDVSSELIHSLLPVFLVTSLGAGTFVVGLIEGAAEATALIVKVFSGVLSDYWASANRWQCSATDSAHCPSHCSRSPPAPAWCWERD